MKVAEATLAAARARSVAAKAFHEGVQEIDSTAISLDTVTELILQALASTPDAATVPAPRVTATGQ